MPRQKDLKRLVRTRMEKTGESYTAARLHLVKPEPVADYAALAGMSDESVVAGTGRRWAQWVALLDAADCAKKPHREIAKSTRSLGTSSWWSQMVAVGYERIRGIRQIGQRSSGDFATSRSRTFNVPVETLFKAFADARTRNRWLQMKATVRSSTPLKRMRLAFADGTIADVGFIAKSKAKASVAIDHQKLAGKSAADAMKTAWGEYFGRLAEILA